MRNEYVFSMCFVDPMTIYKSDKHHRISVVDCLALFQTFSIGPTNWQKTRAREEPPTKQPIQANINTSHIHIDPSETYFSHLTKVIVVVDVSPRDGKGDV